MACLCTCLDSLLVLLRFNISNLQVHDASRCVPASLKMSMETMVGDHLCLNSTIANLSENAQERAVMSSWSAYAMSGCLCSPMFAPLACSMQLCHHGGRYIAVIKSGTACNSFRKATPIGHKYMPLVTLWCSYYDSHHGAQGLHLTAGAQGLLQVHNDYT